MIFGYVKVPEWPPLGKELLIQFTICFLCIICNFGFFLFGFEGGTLVPIPPVSA